jgi:hypothetical protein
MIAAEKRYYMVTTNGLAKTSPFIALDPDEALTYSYRLERYLRALKMNPSLSDEKAMAIANDELSSPLPDFKVETCIEVTEEEIKQWESRQDNNRNGDEGY